MPARRGQAQRFSSRAEVATGSGAPGECTMTHLNEEELVLHYYGEEGETLAAEQHLEGCGECRELYGSLQRVLNIVDSLPIPERGADYGGQVWQRIERRIPARRRMFAFPAPWRWAAAGAV